MGTSSLSPRGKSRPPRTAPWACSSGTSLTSPVRVSTNLMASVRGPHRPGGGTAGAQRLDARLPEHHVLLLHQLVAKDVQLLLDGVVEELRLPEVVGLR